MPFNNEQQAAISASANEDILISAGAGSGKTKTLSERVFELIVQGQVAPDELLVLTFTNNAAYEMKTRILSRFGRNHPDYPKMLSSHVQSFDSFNAYLLRLYAGRFGVSPSFTILPESLADQKKAEAVDQALEEAYRDPMRRLALLDFMEKLGLKNQDPIKESVVYLLECLHRFTPDARAHYIATYKERFQSKAFAANLYHDIIEASKKSLASVLRAAYVKDRLARCYATNGQAIDFEELPKSLVSPTLWKSPLKDLSITEDKDKKGPEDFLKDEFEKLRGLLDLGDEEYPVRCREYLEEYKKIWFGSQYPGARKKGCADAPLHAPVFVALKGAKPILADAAKLGTLEDESVFLTDFQEGTDILFDLVEEVERRLSEYRLSHNAFSFEDVSAFVLSIFTDYRYEDIAEELRQRFRYIMVDEYQDTNDAQEIFLEGLLRTNALGERAHLFCVGDAKQSIYAFRGSNVGLFRDRQRRYLAEEGARVIPMNKNYRSAKRLLHDINHIFSYYMRLDMGGIDYLDEMERLHYDDGVNLYHTDIPAYGVHRIVPPLSEKLEPRFKGYTRFQDDEYEARAILSDIQKKLREGFLVFDRDIKGTRPCRKSDFCILVRRKNSVRVYQKLFYENGIALNNKVSVNLREVNAVILLQSLLDLLGYALGLSTKEFAHRFASVARSYIYQYDDETLHRLLSIEDEKAREEAMNQDKIMLDLRGFCEKYGNSPFREIFLALLQEFHIIDKLYLIGDVEDNVSKIESLYALICQGEGLGKGLSEFISLFHDIDKRSLEISSDTIVENSDAVDFMTIHASKGLERKIVYLPASDNGVGGGGSYYPPFQFSQDLGLCFPRLDPPSLENGDEEKPYLTLPLRKAALDELDEEEQEHVRLLYVALTRAENSVYIVGRDQGEKGVYILFQDVPFSYDVHPDLLSSSSISAGAKNEFMTARNLHVSPVLPQNLDLAEDALGAFVFLRDELKECVAQWREDRLVDLLDEALTSYQRRFVSIESNLDEVAKIYAAFALPEKRSSVQGVASLLSALNDVPEETDEDEDEEAEDEPDDILAETFTDEDLRKRLEQFAQGVSDGAFSLIFPEAYIPTSKKKEELERYQRRVMIDALLFPLASYFDGVDYIFRKSYASEDYEDRVHVYDDATFAESTQLQAPALAELSIDDSPIALPHYQFRRASKKIQDEDFPPEEVLERGNRLHRYLELCDFANPDLSYILDPHEKDIIARALATPLLAEASKADAVYREYGFYDEENLAMGYIDMFYVKDGVYHIVDYKSYSIDDPAYEDQLRAYGRNVCRLFQVTKDHVRLHLLSIGQGVVKDIAFD